MSRQEAKDVLQETNRCLGFKISMVPFESFYHRKIFQKNMNVISETHTGNYQNYILV